LLDQPALLSSRGDYGYGTGERIADRSHVEASVRTAFAYIGITQSWSVAVEYDEFGDERLLASIEKAEQAVDRLVPRLTRSSRSANDHAAA
jgi:FMN-dependent NADH-azoreductase